jgi:zinc-ribbon domain
MRDDDDDEEEEDLDDVWAEDDADETDVVPCPACGAEVYEDAEQCPACGQSIVHGTSPWRGRPRWWILLGLAGIAAVLWWIIPWPAR